MRVAPSQRYERRTTTSTATTTCSSRYSKGEQAAHNHGGGRRYQENNCGSAKARRYPARSSGGSGGYACVARQETSGKVREKPFQLADALGRGFSEIGAARGIGYELLGSAKVAEVAFGAGSVCNGSAGYPLLSQWPAHGRRGRTVEAGGDRRAQAGLRDRKSTPL